MYGKLISETEEEDLTQQITDSVIDDYYRGLNMDFISKFKKTAYLHL